MKVITTQSYVKNISISRKQAQVSAPFVPFSRSKGTPLSAPTTPTISNDAPPAPAEKAIMDKSEKNKIITDMKQFGDYFDGMGEYVANLNRVVNNYGYTVPDDGRYSVLDNQEEGRRMIEFQKNDGSPVKDEFYISWYKMDNGRFEVIGYFAN